MPKVSIPQTAARLQFSKDGPVPAYYVVNESGFERNPPAAELNKGIEIFHEFLDADGNPLTRATVGQEFFVRLRLRATDRDRVPQIAVVDFLPGGFEPVTELQLPADTSAAGVDPALMRRRAAVATLPVGVPGQVGLDSEPCRRARRPRRDLRRGHAETSGRSPIECGRPTPELFQVPPAFAEGMYNRTLTALSLGGKLEIVKP